MNFLLVKFMFFSLSFYLLRVEWFTVNGQQYDSLDDTSIHGTEIGAGVAASAGSLDQRIIGGGSAIASASASASATDQADSEQIYSILAEESNKEFWDNIYTNSLLNTKTKYNPLSGDEKVCFTCPIDRNTFTSLYHEASQNGPQGSIPPRISISWSAQLSENRIIFFCRNNTRMTLTPIYLGSDQQDYNAGAGGGGDESSLQQRVTNGGGDGAQLEYSCEHNRLCLLNLKHNYPENYQCLVKSYVLNVKLNVIVQLQYVILYFSGDSVKFDYQKEVQVHENQMFTVKCEVPETNPVSSVNAYIDNKELKLARLEKKTLDNRMNINTYSYDVNATRGMNGKRVKCEAQMKDLPPELASSIDLRSHISKDYTLSVYYLPTCVFPERTYRTGINRSIIIECPINGSNPDVTYYKLIPPSTRTKFEAIDSDLSVLRRLGRYRINPQSQADFGLYECIPRSLAGTAKCDINVELGATPNPPEQCSVQFAKVNNKTFAQFSCRPGFNQGGASSFLTIYEINLADRQLKLSGRVNIDESKVDKEVPYITPADEDKYYEFLVMQENNYGNSSSVLLTLGTSEEAKIVAFWDSRTILMFAGGAGLALLFICLCGCCCCTDLFSSSKSDSACCRCCSSDHLDEDGSTYKKAPLDADAMAGSSVSQPFQSFNSDLNPKHGLIGASTYDYYDNTSTGLLTENQGYTRQQYHNGKVIRNSKQPPTPLGLNYEETNEDDSYNHNNYNENDEDEEEDEDEDHYMANPDVTFAKRESRFHATNDLEENGDNFSINENGGGDESSASSSAGRKSSSNGDDQQQAFIHQSNSLMNSLNNTASRKSQIYSNSSNHVQQLQQPPPSVMTDTYSRNFKQQNATKLSSSSSNNINSNNYSTIDSKNLKFIKTENGLVYTPLNQTSTMKKNKSSNDGSSIMIEEEEIDERHYNLKEDNYVIIEIDKDQQRNNNNRVAAPKSAISTYSHVKKITQMPLNKNNNQNIHLQNELTLKLKSISSNKEQQQQHQQQQQLDQPNQTIKNQKQISFSQADPMSNSTATTSLSSASSCTSNSDLNLKKETFSTNTLNSNKRVGAPLLNDLNGSATNINTNVNSINLNSNKTYSLLKTTINVNGTSEIINEHNNNINSNGNGNISNNQNSNNGTLNRPKPNGTLQNQAKSNLNGNTNGGSNYSNGTYKPPILKPKPRANNIYQSTSGVGGGGGGGANGNQSKKQPSSTSESIHNQSIEPLLNSTNLRETSLHTSPSTSVTDVSSNNCTPQHYNSNVDDVSSTPITNSSIKPLLQQQQPPLPRSRSNSLTRNNGSSSTTQNYQTLNGIPKATTTFATSTASNGGSLIYSTTKINGAVNGGDLVASSSSSSSYPNGTTTNGNNMRTFITQNSSNYSNINNTNGNGNYESTINRKHLIKKQLSTIDDEISITNGNANNNNNNHKLANTNGMQRTLERRHVKNSEC